MQLEKGLINAKTIKPSLIAPLFITRVNPFDSPREFEGIDSIEMPGSAPSALRSPFDIPYDPFEEKPILTGGSFNIEFTSKDLLLEPRQDPDAREKRLVYPTVRMLPGHNHFIFSHTFFLHSHLYRLGSSNVRQSQVKLCVHLSLYKCPKGSAYLIHIK